jgi:hypothetical protein
MHLNRAGLKYPLSFDDIHTSDSKTLPFEVQAATAMQCSLSLRMRMLLGKAVFTLITWALIYNAVAKQAFYSMPGIYIGQLL